MSYKNSTSVFLPHDVLRTILSFVPLRARLHVLLRVCKLWKSLCTDSVTHLPTDFPPQRVAQALQTFPRIASCTISMHTDAAAVLLTLTNPLRTLSIRFAQHTACNTAEDAAGFRCGALALLTGLTALEIDAVACYSARRMFQQNATSLTQVTLHLHSETFPSFASSHLLPWLSQPLPGIKSYTLIAENAFLSAWGAHLGYCTSILTGLHLTNAGDYLDTKLSRYQYPRLLSLIVTIPFPSVTTFVQAAPSLMRAEVHGSEWTSLPPYLIVGTTVSSSCTDFSHLQSCPNLTSVHFNSDARLPFPLQQVTSLQSASFTFTCLSDFRLGDSFPIPDTPMPHLRSLHCDILAGAPPALYPWHEILAVSMHHYPSLTSLSIGIQGHVRAGEQRPICDAVEAQLYHAQHSPLRRLCFKFKALHDGVLQLGLARMQRQFHWLDIVFEW